MRRMVERPAPSEPAHCEEDDSKYADGDAEFRLEGPLVASCERSRCIVAHRSGRNAHYASDEGACEEKAVLGDGEIVRWWGEDLRERIRCSYKE